MRKSVLSFLLCVVTLTCPAFAAPSRKHAKFEGDGVRKLYQSDYGVGLALGLGTQSGFSGVMPWDRQSFIQGQFGASLTRGSYSLSGDYVMVFNQLFGSSTVVPYLGAGGIVLIGSNYTSLVSDTDGDLHVGARLPIGIYMILTKFPIQLFTEMTPGILFLAKFDTILSINFGFRWLFF